MCTNKLAQKKKKGPQTCTETRSTNTQDTKSRKKNERRNVERERDRTEQHFLDEKAVVLDYLRHLPDDCAGHAHVGHPRGTLDTSAESAFVSDLRSSQRRCEFWPYTNTTLASNV
ncbi:unnamed protein product [Ixodes pacificus]